MNSLDIKIINKTNLIFHILLYFVYLFLIILIILRYFDYQFGNVTYTGDLRIHSSLPSENSNSLFNFRLMTHSTPFLSLFPILSLFDYLSIESIYFFILFIIPILAFISMEIILSKYIGDIFYKNFNLKNFISTSLSFIYIINPSYFNRIGHWNINLTYVFVPPFFYLVDKFLKQNSSYFNLLILSPIIFFGVSNPHALVAFTGIIIILLLFNIKFNKEYFLKSISLTFIHFLAVSHNFLSMYLDKGLMIKTSWEGTTDSEVLQSLSKNSDFITSLSGTNYYFESISYPTLIGPGFLIFVFLLISLFWKNVIKRRKIAKENIKFIIFILIFFLINLGYKTLPFLYENIFFHISYIKDLLWLIKDSNIFYNYLIFFLIIFFAKKIVKTNVFFIIFSTLLLVLLNIYINYFSNTEIYNNFFKQIKIPKEYNEVRDFLEKENKRSIWIPYQTYISFKNETNLTWFPNPNLWLTKNSEIVTANPNYNEFITTLQNEVVTKKCLNKTLISWLIKSNDLLIVVNEDSHYEYIQKYKECIGSIQEFKKLFVKENISVYASELNLIETNELVEFKGSLEELNDYLKKNPYSMLIIGENTGKTKNKINTIDHSFVKKVYYSYDENLTFNNEKLKQKVNIISSTYEPTIYTNMSGIAYKNDDFFKSYLKFIFLFNCVLGVLSIFIILYKLRLIFYRNLR